MTQKVLSKIFATLGTALAAAVLVFGLSQAASAATLTTSLEFSFGNGSCGGPGNTTTCKIDVTIADTGANEVTMTINATNLEGGTITEFYANLTSIPGDISATTSGSVATVQFGSDSFKADGDGFFDVFIDLNPPGPGNDSIGDGGVFTIVFTGTGLNATDFDSNSVPGGGAGSGFCLAAHVQQTGTDNQDSDWMAGSCDGTPVPEPSSLLLFGTGLLVLGAVTRRRRKIA